jgi:uncharacterized protein YbjT (DUF2867 family)
MILVTGATGTVGQNVVESLAARRARVRVGARDPGRAAAALAHLDGVEVVELDHARPATYAAAMRGVDRLFLLAPVVEDQVGISVRLVDAAARAGVGRSRQYLSL